MVARRLLWVRLEDLWAWTPRSGAGSRVGGLWVSRL